MENNEDDNGSTELFDQLESEEVIPSDEDERLPLLKNMMKPIREKGLKESLKWCCGICCMFCCLCSSVFVLILCLVFYFVFRYPVSHHVKCGSKCQYSLVESIPTEVDLVHLNTLSSHEVVRYMLSNSKKSVKTMQFYFELRNDAVPEARGDYGNEIYEMYLDTINRGIDVEIIYNKVSDQFADEMEEINAFSNAGAKVYSFDFEKYFGGVLHSKVIIVDDESFYIGSLNMDWKSFSQVKELGIYVRNCPCLANDVGKIFEVLRWYLKDEQVDEGYDTGIHMNKTVEVEMEYIDGLEHYNRSKSSKGHYYITSSPFKLNTIHRTSDIDAILHIINRAEKFIHVSVMDFLPLRMYADPRTYWGKISDALKVAMIERDVEVRLLLSKWNYTDSMQTVFLHDINVFGSICENSTRGGDPKKPFCTGRIVGREIFIPDAKEFHPQYNFTRVNHPKYMVTDRDLFVSTSNWVQDYFFDTGGVSFVSDDEVMRGQLKEIFHRDWTSKYSHEFKVKDYENCNN